MGAAVDEVAEKDGLAFGVLVDALVPGVAQLLEESLEGVSVAVDIADQVVHVYEGGYADAVDAIAAVSERSGRPITILPLLPYHRRLALAPRVAAQSSQHAEEMQDGTFPSLASRA
jgi:hypothetical protein